MFGLFIAMIIVLTCTIILQIILFIFAQLKNSEDLVCYGGMLLFIIIPLILGSISIYNSHAKSYEYQKYIKITSDTTNNFVLDVNCIEDKRYYIFYEKLDKNSFKECQVETKNVILIETDLGKPKIIFLKEPWETEKITIYIPKGTIIKQLL